MPGDRLGHAEMSIGEGRFMLADEFAEMGCVSPLTHGGTSVGLALYVDDADHHARRAVEAGAVLERPVADQFYGDRVAYLKDPFGHRWTLHARLEDVLPDGMRRRMARP